MASAEGGSVLPWGGIWEGVFPLYPTRESGGASWVPLWGLGQSPGRKRILAYFDGHRTLLFHIYDKKLMGQYELASPYLNSGGETCSPSPMIYTHAADWMETLTFDAASFKRHLKVFFDVACTVEERSINECGMRTRSNCSERATNVRFCICICSRLHLQSTGQRHSAWFGDCRSFCADWEEKGANHAPNDTGDGELMCSPTRDATLLHRVMFP